MSAMDFASAFGTYVEDGTVILGRDTRRAGERLRSAVIAGLLSTGINLYDLGVVPTPVSQYALTQLGVKGGVSISGPSVRTEWKALRFFGPDGAPLNTYQNEELLDIFHNGSFSYVPWNQIGRLDLYDSALQMYADALKEFLDVDAIRGRQYKIVLDCCNGTASHFVESLFTDMGCEVVAINNEPSPDAKYEPLPEEKNTQAVCQIVKPLGADVGFYFNIDATSLVVISDQGVSLGEEYTFGLLTEYILSQHPGKAIVTNVSTTGLIDDLGRKYNATVSRCPIGQRYVIERMRSISAVFGGEGSGGAAYPQFLYAFDGILSMGLVLQMLAHRQTRVSEIVRSFPKYLIKKGFINCPVYLFHSVLARVMEQFADQELDLTDGVKVFLDDGWLHIRPSRNEAIIRVIAESRDADDVEQLLHLGKTEVRKAMVST